MGVIGVIILGILGLVALMAFIIVVWAVLKFIAVVIASAVIGGAIGLVAGGLGLDTALAAGIGLITGILAAYKLYKVIPGPGADAPIEVASHPLEVPPTATERYCGQIEPLADTKVTDAWLKLAEMLPDQKLHILHQVRNRCAQLLELTSETSLDITVLEWRVHFSRNLSALADEYASRWRFADNVQQTQMIETMMEDLINIEKYADKIWSSIQSDKADDLTVIRTHLAQRASGS